MASSTGGVFGVRRPDRSVGGMRRQGPVDRFDEAVGEDERIQEGSFGLDPGMRAADEFQDVASAGYRENAKRVAERGGAEQYSTSVGQEEAEAASDELRNAVALILASLAGGGALGARGAAGRVPPARPAPGSLPFMGGRSLLTEAEKASIMDQLRREKMNNLLRGGRLPLPNWLNR